MNSSLGIQVTVMSPVDDDNNISSSQASRENEVVPGMSGITDPELPAKQALAGRA